MAIDFPAKLRATTADGFLIDDEQVDGPHWSSGSAAPTGGAAGDLYLRTGNTAPGIYLRGVSDWRLSLSTEAGAAITTGTAAPSGGSEGDIYIRTGSTAPGIYRRGATSWTLLIAPGADGADGSDGADGAAGQDGNDGAAGTNGWAPVLSVITSGQTRVLRLTDWTGGTGTKPAVPTNNYITATGLGTAGNAINIRGAQGPAGQDGAAGMDATAPDLQKLLERTSAIHDQIESTTFSQPQNAQVTLVGHGTYSDSQLTGLQYEDDRDSAESDGSFGVIFRVPMNETVNNPVGVITRGSHVIWRLATGWADRGIHGNFRYYTHRGAYGTGNTVAGESMRNGDTVHIEGTSVTTEIVPEWDGAIDPSRILTGVAGFGYTSNLGLLVITLVDGRTLSANIGAELVTGVEGEILEEAAADKQRRLDAVGLTSTIGAFADATTADLRRGYGFFAPTVTTFPNVESAPYVLPSGAPPSGVAITPEIQVPRGVNPDRVRLQHIRNNAVLETLPRSTDEWRRLAGRNTTENQNRYTDRYDAVVSADLPLVVHDTVEMRAGDILRLQLAPETFEFDGGGQSAAGARIPEKLPFAAVPVAADAATVDAAPAGTPTVGSIFTAFSGSNVTVAAGAYLVTAKAAVAHTGARAYPQPVIRDPSNDNVLAQLTSTYYRGDGADATTRDSAFVGYLNLAAARQVVFGCRQQERDPASQEVGTAFTLNGFEVEFAPLGTQGAVGPAGPEGPAGEDGGGPEITNIILRESGALAANATVRMGSGDAAVIGNDDEYYSIAAHGAGGTLYAFSLGRVIRRSTSYGTGMRADDGGFRLWVDPANGRLMALSERGQTVMRCRVDKFDYGLPTGSGAPPQAPPTRYTYFGKSLSTAALADIDHIADRASIHPTPFGDYDVNGIDPDTLVRLWWLVDSDLTQPTSWSSGLEDLTDVISQQPAVTIGGRTFTFWVLDAPNAVGPRFNGATISVS